MDFVAIDFETASQRPDSPCQLAVVDVQGGEIQAEQCWLIRPRSMDFSPHCIAVHGIQPHQVAGEPQWYQLWRQIAPWLEGRLVIAHNASFDMRVLSETLATYDLACPDLDYSCTRLIARRAWPEEHGYGLSSIAERLGIVFRHHDALEDARTCARVALEAAAKTGCQTFGHLEQHLGITRGRLRLGQLIGPRTMRRKKVACELEQPPSAPAPRRRSRSARAVDQLAHLDGWLQLLHGARPLEGKSVALIGTLFGMPIEESLLLLEAMGASVQGRQNLKTDLVILGQASATSSSQPDQPLGVAQLTQATKRQADGQPIKILTQRQLLAWIPGGMDRVRELTGS